jgi:hypothetical protein
MGRFSRGDDLKVLTPIICIADRHGQADDSAIVYP